MRTKEGSFLEVFRYRDLIKGLVGRDIKLKYRRSFLGYVWSVLNPLLIMIVMVIVFSHMFNQQIEHFAVYLFAGRIVYEFVISACGKALGSITDNASLIKKTYVSKFIFPLAGMTSTLVDSLLSLGAFLIVIIFTGAPFFWTMLLFPFVFIQAYVFACGLGFFLAQMHVFFRDTRYIWNAITTMWMYCSAIFYPVTMLPDWLKFLVDYFNPIYIYIKQFRDIVHMGQLPDMTTLALGVFYAVLAFAIGEFAFRKNQNKFILYI